MVMDKEDVVLKSQGSVEIRSIWRIGQLHLTKNRLYFIQMKKNLFVINLEKIIKISIIKRGWILGCKIKQLCIFYQSDKGEEHVFIALAAPEKWDFILKRTMALKLIERCGYNGAEPESPSDS
ncbi:hypothetical protein [Anaerosacchariphilus polymeriproducens]|uniref:GRAM domain-containing protein n=1 Tax=Anaerosacchariphilus polymeriproducens TaxID=1812858 RepID=A0A371AZL2_9FIRM|nr:hypothetical protein [Anaerosacchariphilus polymeriproducens]RDU24983.1 hypothetical protein DWV06_01780 [Anaerosacchariphilus polymeriproducens]